MLTRMCHHPSQQRFPFWSGVYCSTWRHKEVEPLLLTISQVAALLNIGRSSVYDLIRTKGLPTVSLGGRNTRVRKTSLEVWIQQQEHQADA